MHKNIRWTCSSSTCFHWKCFTPSLCKLLWFHWLLHLLNVSYFELSNWFNYKMLVTIQKLDNWKYTKVLSLQCRMQPASRCKKSKGDKLSFRQNFCSFCVRSCTHLKPFHSEKRSLPLTAREAQFVLAKISKSLRLCLSFFSLCVQYLLQVNRNPFTGITCAHFSQALGTDSWCLHFDFVSGFVL